MDGAIILFYFYELWIIYVRLFVFQIIYKTVQQRTFINIFLQYHSIHIESSDFTVFILLLYSDHP